MPWPKSDKLSFSGILAIGIMVVSVIRVLAIVADAEDIASAAAAIGFAFFDPAVLCCYALLFIIAAVCRDDIREFLHILKKDRPEFIVKIENVLYGPAQDGVRFVITVMLSNRSAPGSVIRWRMRHLTTDATTEGAIERLENNLPIYSSDNTQVLRVILPQDSLYQLAASPIPQNSFVAGHLVALVPIETNRAGNAKLEVSCVDVFGNWSSGTFDLPAGMDPRSITDRFPGIDS